MLAQRTRITRRFAVGMAQKGALAWDLMSVQRTVGRKIAGRTTLSIAKNKKFISAYDYYTIYT